MKVFIILYKVEFLQLLHYNAKRPLREMDNVARVHIIEKELSPNIQISCEGWKILNDNRVSAACLKSV